MGTPMFLLLIWVISLHISWNMKPQCKLVIYSKHCMFALFLCHKSFYMSDMHVHFSFQVQFSIDWFKHLIFRGDCMLAKLSGTTKKQHQHVCQEAQPFEIKSFILKQLSYFRTNPAKALNRYEKILITSVKSCISVMCVQLMLHNIRKIKSYMIMFYLSDSHQI